MPPQLYSKRHGKLNCTHKLPFVLTDCRLPGADYHCYTSTQNNSYFLFQEFEEKGTKIRYNTFYSDIKDTIVLIDEPVITLRLAVSGSHTICIPQMAPLLLLERGYNILQIPNNLVEYPIESQQKYSFLEVILSKETWLLSDSTPVKDFLDRVHLHFPTRLALHNLVATTEMLSWVDTFIDLGNISAANNIVYASLRNIEPSHRGIRMNEKEIEKIYSISNLLINTDQELSLKELSLNFDLSIYKINNGFKQVFGHSVLQHRREEKMRMALRIIHQGKTSIKRLAYTLGYWPQNFSRIFKKRFGYSPGQHSSFNL